MSSVIIGGFNEIGDRVYNPAIDDYEWVSSAGQGYPTCLACCECTPYLLEARNRYAIRSKRGIQNYTPTSPPTIYRTITYSGSIAYSAGIPYANFSGGRTFGLNSGYDSDTKQVVGYYGASPSYDFIANGFFFATENQTAGWPSPWGSGPNTTCVISESGASASVSNCPDYYTIGGVSAMTETLSDEYTTSSLIAYTVADLPPYSAGWTESPSAFRNLSIDEVSYAIQESQYRFRFKVPKVGSGSQYIIKWTERFTPEGGGASTDTVKTFTWDGTVPVGYDDTNSATWPLSPEYTLAIPTSDGTTTITCVVATCQGTAPTDPCNP